MKSMKLLFLTIAIVSMSFNRPDSSLTDEERNYAAHFLMETKEELLKKVKDLTVDQLNWKPDESSWTVAECVEHIAISENDLFGFSQMSLKEPADPSKRNEVKMSDVEVVKMITDRTHKFKTTEAFEPTGKFGSFDATLKEFVTRRDSNINYIKTTADDLRNHFNDFPFGRIDAYQTILFMAAHAKRHTDQINEVINNPKFPGKRK